MSEYRLDHVDYAEANEVEYSQSVGAYSYTTTDITTDTDSDKTEKKAKEPKDCYFCRGTKKCHVCNGHGYVTSRTGWDTYSSVLRKEHNYTISGYGASDCSLCKGTGRCTHCF